MGGGGRPGSKARSNSSSNSGSSFKFTKMDSGKITTSQFKNFSNQPKQNLVLGYLFSMTSPLVAMVGVSDYDCKEEKQKQKHSNALPDKMGVQYDYKNVIDVFYGMKNWNVMYQTTDNETKCLSQNKKNDLKINKHDQCKRWWIHDDIRQFNDKVFARIKNASDDNDVCKYDGLIYILSANINNDHGQHTLYDSLSNKYPIDEIFDKFDNINCRYLRNKPKIFILDGNDPSSPLINTSNFISNNQLNKDPFNNCNCKPCRLRKIHQMKLSEQDKFIIYNNMESWSHSWSDTNGGYLINAICSTIADDHVTPKSDHGDDTLSSSAVATSTSTGINTNFATSIDTIVEEAENKIAKTVGNINIFATARKFIVTEDYVPGWIVVSKLANKQEMETQSQKESQKESKQRGADESVAKTLKSSSGDLIYEILESTNYDLNQSMAIYEAMLGKDENENKVNKLNQQKKEFVRQVFTKAIQQHLVIKQSVVVEFSTQLLEAGCPMDVTDQVLESTNYDLYKSMQIIQAMYPRDEMGGSASIFEQLSLSLNLMLYLCVCVGGWVCHLQMLFCWKMIVGPKMKRF